MTPSNRLARARADKRELEWVTRRISDAREERARIAAQLAIAEQARTYEQADVDALGGGIGGFFRRMLADHAELSKEQQELAAAQLLCDELTDELRAIDADLGQLSARAKAVADAPVQYANALADAEAQARERGELQSELDALAAAEAELSTSRREIQHAINVGLTVQQRFRHVVDLVRELHPGQHEVEPILGEGLLATLFGNRAASYAELCDVLAGAQQGLRQLEQEASELLNARPAGLDMRIAPMPTTGRFVFRDVVWFNGALLENLLPEISRVSSALSSSIGELRARDAALEQARADCDRMRARLLDPG